MSNLADSDEILGADDFRLVDAQDLVLMLFPNVAGNDKGGAMTFAQFAARLEGCLTWEERIETARVDVVL